MLNQPRKIEGENEPCRKCGGRKRFEVPFKKRKSRRYYFLGYLICVRCGEMYMVPQLRLERDANPTPQQMDLLYSRGYRIVTVLETQRHQAIPI